MGIRHESPDVLFVGPSGDFVSYERDLVPA